MDTMTWHDKAEALSFRTQAFINGHFVDSASGETFEIINPATGHLLAHVARCTDQDVELAVRAARQAFESRVWCGLPPAERKAILLNYAKLIDEHKEEFALLESLDMGKPISDAMGYDAPATARCVQWNAEAIDKVYDEVAPVTEGALALVTREALASSPLSCLGTFLLSWPLGR